MKIAYLIPGCGVSGGIAVVCQHVNRLKNRGHNVLLISENGERVIDWFPNQCVNIVGLDDVPDDLDVLVATAWSTAFRVAVLPAKHKFYFVQSDETRFHPKNSAWEHITRLTYSIAFNYITEARWIKKWLFEGFGHDAALVPNGLDDKLFFPVEPLVPKGNKPRVLLEGAIGLPYKGMAEAFEAIQDLDVEVWCVSSYGKPDKSWKCDRFFERVPMTEMKHVYASCDILLKLSRVEGFFGPPMEMMACGGVAVVGKVTGYDEYIEDGVNALVVDANKPSEARQAVKKLLDDSELRNRLIENGKITAGNWQWESSIDILERRFVDVVEGNRGVAYFSNRLELAHSINFFYQQMSGKSLYSASQDADKHGMPPIDNAEANAQFEFSERVFELSATEKLLDWLRTRRWFRAFAKLVWKAYSRNLNSRS